MAAILFIFLAVTYVFSGIICWLAFLRDFNQRSSLSGWQRLISVLASFVIVVFWPIGIIIGISKLNSSEPETLSLAYQKNLG